MKRFIASVVVLIAILAAAEVALNRTDGAAGAAPALAGAPASTDSLARGEYLTKAADCVACHTVPESGRRSDRSPKALMNRITPRAMAWASFWR